MIPQQQLPDERKSLNAQTLQAPLRWPLVTQPANRNTSYTKDARLTNCYAERQEDGLFTVEKRFGIGPNAWNLGGAGIQGQGMFNVDLGTTQNSTYLVANNTVYSISLHISAPQLNNLGTILTNAYGVFGGQGTIQWCLVQAAPPGPYLVFSSGNRAPAYYIPLNGGGAISQITDVNFPTDNLVPGIVILDGTTYVMDQSSNIWGSAGLNNPIVWSALNVIQANAISDLPIALYRQLFYVVAFKSTSIQFFYDAGNATGSPLSPVPGALINYGCLDANTIQEIDGILLFATSNKYNVNQVAMLENLQFRLISTPAIERFLNLTPQLPGAQYFNVYSFASFIINYAGHRLYGLTNYLSNITMVYDIDQRLWYQWTDANGNYWPVMSISTDLSNNLLCQPVSTGFVNFLGPDYTYPSDNGAVFPVDIYTPNFDAGVDRQKYLSQMRFNADQTDGSTLYVRNSDDDYQTWTNFRRVDLSQVRPIMNDCGTFYRRAYHIRHSANTALRIKSVDLQMDLGTL